MAGRTLTSTGGIVLGLALVAPFWTVVVAVVQAVTR